MPDHLLQRLFGIATCGDDDGNIGALCDREGPRVQRQKRRVGLVARALREDRDGGLLVFEDVDGVQDRFQRLPVVFPVDKREAADVRVAPEDRHVFHLRLADVDDLRALQKRQRNERVDHGSVICDEQKGFRPVDAVEPFGVYADPSDEQNKLHRFRGQPPHAVMRLRDRLPLVDKQRDERKQQRVQDHPRKICRQEQQRDAQNKPPRPARTERKGQPRGGPRGEQQDQDPDQHFSSSVRFHYT